MKIKKIVSTALLVAIAVLGANTLHAEDAVQPNPVAMSQAPSKPAQVIGIVLVNPNDNSNAMILTKVQDPQDPKNPQGKMIGIPLKLDDKGNKLVEEFGIIGAKPDEKDGMERVQKETQTKVVFLNGVLNLSEGAGRFEVSDYMPIAEFQNKVQAAATAKPVSKTAEK